MKSQMTLSELSAKLCTTQNEDDLRRISRKIQNWVTDGIVQPISGKHEGRGVHRQYDEFESYKIAVLLEATRLKLPGVVLQMISGLFNNSHTANPNFQSKTGIRPQPSVKKNATTNFNQLIKRAKLNKTAYMSLTLSDADTQIQVAFYNDESFLRHNSSAIALNITLILSDLVSDKT